MPSKAKIPEEIVEELKLAEPKRYSVGVKLLFDSKQYSMKIPARVSADFELHPTDKFELTIENADVLTLRRTKRGGNLK
jgi:hypothetical protein